MFSQTRGMYIELISWLLYVNYSNHELHFWAYIQSLFSIKDSYPGDINGETRGYQADDNDEIVGLTSTVPEEVCNRTYKKNTQSFVVLL